MRIWCQLPMQFDAADPKTRVFFDLIEAGFRLVKRQETEVNIVPLTRGIATMSWMTYPGLRFLNEREIVKSALKGEREGYDGILIANYFDSGLQAVRQLTSLPVTGFAESTMLFACTVGHKFATIVANEKFIVPMEQTIERYGLRTRAIDYKPVRSLTLTYDDILAGFEGEYTALIEEFMSTARVCIADGAEVILAGGGIFSLLLTQSGLRTIEGVPFLDPFLVSLKVLEVAVELHQSGIPIASRASLYLTPHKEEVEEALNFFASC